MRATEEQPGLFDDPAPAIISLKKHFSHTAVRKVSSSPAGVPWDQYCKKYLAEHGEYPIY